MFRRFAAAAVVCASVSAPAFAAPYIVTVSGTTGTAGQFHGTLNLDVANGKAISGTGKLTYDDLELTNVGLTLITDTTPYNESTAYGPIGFRANDGTDILGGDQAYPIDEFGLLFAVGTATPTPNGNPLFGVYRNSDGSGGSVFDGNVNGITYYFQIGNASIAGVAGAVPEPATWAMMLMGFGMVGFGLRYRRKQPVRVAFG